jgi:hypothetical protein
MTHMEAILQDVIHMEAARADACRNQAADHADASHKAAAHADAARRAVLSGGRFLARRNRSYRTSCAAWTIKTRATGASKVNSVRQQLP